ncbi:neuroligin-2-like, partial [Sitophilus oryzae]|uniref:Neuroligin-2-like n=1 Tax=Sitophilus oryzae TaxID=7048 RepID=A0A6J2YCV2_SITOR
SSTRGETETGPPRYSSRIVEIQTGAIRGIILELNSRHLEPVEVFRGVPYAAPPVGPLRFQPPQAPVSWPGTRLADTFGAVCPQKYPDITNRTAALQFMPKGRYQYLKKLLPLLANQSEDCLFLNIYVPGSGKPRDFLLSLVETVQVYLDQIYLIKYTWTKYTWTKYWSKSIRT